MSDSFISTYYADAVLLQLGDKLLSVGEYNAVTSSNCTKKFKMNWFFFSSARQCETIKLPRVLHLLIWWLNTEAITFRSFILEILDDSRYTFALSLKIGWCYASTNSNNTNFKCIQQTDWKYCMNLFELQIEVLHVCHIPAYFSLLLQFYIPC